MTILSRTRISLRATFAGDWPRTELLWSFWTSLIASGRNASEGLQALFQDMFLEFLAESLLVFELVLLSQLQTSLPEELVFGHLQNSSYELIGQTVLAAMQMGLWAEERPS